MPPNQPVHRCQGRCGLLRPCKAVGGPWLRWWLCAECNPLVDAGLQEASEDVDVVFENQLDAGVEPPTAVIATDGGADDAD
jgi:hypothetical protein